MWKNIFFLAALLSLMAMPVHAADVILTINQYYDVETGDIGTDNASMDFFCSRVQSAAGFWCNTGNPSDGALLTAAHNTRFADQDPETGNAFGLVWGDNLLLYGGGCDSSRVYRSYTTNNNWAFMSQFGSTTGQCKFTVNTINTTPFYTGTFGTSNTATFQVNDTVSVQVDFADLGVYYDNNTYSSYTPILGMDSHMDIYNSYVDVLNGSRATLITPVTYPNTQIGYLTNTLNCNGLQSSNTTAAYTALNVIGISPVCWYEQLPVGYAGGFMVNETTTALGDPDNVRKDFRINLAYYKLDTFTVITSVSHSPSNPQPNQTVTISFASTLPQNGTVFLRYRNVSAGGGEINYTNWFSFFDTMESFTHNIAANGTYILDGKFYQYYVVVSDSVNNTNNGAYYNFTVGALGSGGIDIGPGSLPTGASQLEDSGACEGSSCYWYIGLLITGIFTLISWHFGGGLLGKAVGLSLITILALYNVLPQALIVPIIALTALVVARTFGWLGGKNG